MKAVNQGRRDALRAREDQERRIVVYLAPGPEVGNPGHRVNHNLAFVIGRHLQTTFAKRFDCIVQDLHDRLLSPFVHRVSRLIYMLFSENRWFSSCRLRHKSSNDWIGIQRISERIARPTALTTDAASSSDKTRTSILTTFGSV